MATLANSRLVEYDLKQTLSQKPLQGLWRLATGYQLTYIVATAAMGLAALAKVATFFLLRFLIDDVLPMPNVLQVLPLVALAFVGVALLEGGFTFTGREMANRVAEKVTIRLREYLFDHLQRLNFTYHDSAKSGDLIQRSSSDVDMVRMFYAGQAIMLGRILLLFIVMLIALMTLNVQLALLSVIVVPPVVALSFFFFSRISTAYEAFQEQDGKLSTTLQENLNGVRVVKAFAAQGFEMNKFEDDNQEQYRRGKVLLFNHSISWPFTDFLIGAQTIFSYSLGVIFAINGTITPGTFVAFTGMFVWLVWPMRNIGRLIVEISMGLVSLDRVQEVLREERELLDDGVHQPGGDVRGEIVFENVSFEYEVDTPVLNDISFRVEPGQTVALLGSTGSGKTTLISLIPRFYDVEQGRILLDGVDLREYSREYLRQQIGVVEQEPFLFSRSIRDNIAYGVGREVTDEEVHEAARAAAVHEVIMSFPNQYETLVGERGVTLSGGQKQRVALARTLLKNPRILLLDDATSSVDTETESAIREALQNMMGDRTTFIIAHRIQSVMIADVILVFDQGRIVQRGTHDELMAVEGMYRQTYEMQARIEQDLEKELAHVGI
ncbi:MAG: ABC transporter ATP-binding protein [Chloroflexi bacterium]|nr:ABC transporter ATP-binding protein [Chloroflexota bacterium]